jgi:hypothetical protein
VFAPAELLVQLVKFTVRDDQLSLSWSECREDGAGCTHVRDVIRPRGKTENWHT